MDCKTQCPCLLSRTWKYAERSDQYIAFSVQDKLLLVMGLNDSVQVFRLWLVPNGLVHRFILI